MSYETVFMYFLCALLWFFLIAPIVVSMLGCASVRFLEQVKLGAYMTIAIAAIIAVTLLVFLVLGFIGGDPEPITTLINNMQKGK